MIWAGMLVTWEPGGLMRLHLGHRRNFLVLRRSDAAALAAYDATVDADGTVPVVQDDNRAPLDSGSEALGRAAGFYPEGPGSTPGAATSATADAPPETAGRVFYHLPDGIVMKTDADLAGAETTGAQWKTIAQSYEYERDNAVEALALANDRIERLLDAAARAARRQSEADYLISVQKITIGLKREADEDGTIPTPYRDSTAPSEQHDNDIAPER